MGTAEWAGTPLAPLLDEAGVRDEAVEVLFTGLDLGVEGGACAGVRALAAVADVEHALLAYEMNGAPLPPQHGYPLRLVVPGWYGMTNVKWLTRSRCWRSRSTATRTPSPTGMYDADGRPASRSRGCAASLMIPARRAGLLTRERFLEPGPVTLRGAPGRGRPAGRAGGGVHRRRRELRRGPRSTSRSGRRLARLALRLGRAAGRARAPLARHRRRRQQPAAGGGLEPQGLRQQRSRADPRWCEWRLAPTNHARCVRIFSGIQPTGRKHLGNYIGAIRGYLEGQERADPAIYCIVDLHATGVAYEPAALPGYVLDTTAMLLAAGARPRALHPVPPVRRPRAHRADLAARVGHGLRRPPAHAPVQGEVGARAGARRTSLFLYPVLQAAGHPALPHRRGAGGRRPAPARRAGARDRAPLQRDLRRDFVEPEAVIPEVGARIMDLQDPTEDVDQLRHRSGLIYIDDEPNAIRRKLKRAQTDSGREVCAPDKPASQPDRDPGRRPRRRARGGRARVRGQGYGAFKQAVAEAVVELLAPVRERYRELRADEQGLSGRSPRAPSARARSPAADRRGARGDGHRAGHAQGLVEPPG